MRSMGRCSANDTQGIAEQAALHEHGGGQKGLEDDDVLGPETRRMIPKRKSVAALTNVGL